MLKGSLRRETDFWGGVMGKTFGVPGTRGVL